MFIHCTQQDDEEENELARRAGRGGYADDGSDDEYFPSAEPEEMEVHALSEERSRLLALMRGVRDQTAAASAAGEGEGEGGDKAEKSAEDKEKQEKDQEKEKKRQDDALRLDKSRFEGKLGWAAIQQERYDPTSEESNDRFILSTIEKLELIENVRIKELEREERRFNEQGDAFFALDPNNNNRISDGRDGGNGGDDDGEEEAAQTHADLDQLRGIFQKGEGEGVWFGDDGTLKDRVPMKVNPLSNATVTEEEDGDEGGENDGTSTGTGNDVSTSKTKKVVDVLSDDIFLEAEKRGLDVRGDSNRGKEGGMTFGFFDLPAGADGASGASYGASEELAVPKVQTMVQVRFFIFYFYSLTGCVLFHME